MRVWTGPYGNDSYSNNDSNNMGWNDIYFARVSASYKQRAKAYEIIGPRRSVPSFSFHLSEFWICKEFLPWGDSGSTARKQLSMKTSTIYSWPACELTAKPH